MLNDVTTCGSDVSGFAYCWEGNPRGEMDTGDQEGSTTPKRVATDLEFRGVTTQGNLYCWGLGVSGQRGDGTENYATSIPTQVEEPKSP